MEEIRTWIEGNGLSVFPDLVMEIPSNEEFLANLNKRDDIISKIKKKDFMTRWIEFGRRKARKEIIRSSDQESRAEKEKKAREKKPELDEQRVRTALSKFIPDIQKIFIELKKEGYIDGNERFSTSFYYKESLINYGSAANRPAARQSGGSYSFDTDYVPYGMGLTLGKVGELFIFLRRDNRVYMVCSGHLREVVNKKRTVRVGLEELLSGVIQSIEV